MSSGSKGLTVYKAGSSNSIFRVIADVLIGYKEGFGLGLQLAKRDIKAQYRQSALGLLWALVTPVAQALVWVFLSRSQVFEVGDTGVAYVAYVLPGIALWQSFVEALNAPLSMFNTSKGVMRKINFNKEALIIGGGLKVLFNLALKLLIVIPVLIFNDVVWSNQMLLAPFVIFAMLLFGLALGILITPLGALWTDVSRLINSVTQLLFLLTPFVYPRRVEGALGLMDTYNPLAIAVCNARDVMLGLPIADSSIYFLFLGLTVVGFLFFAAFYRISLPIIIERMGA